MMTPTDNQAGGDTPGVAVLAERLRACQDSRQEYRDRNREEHTAMSEHLAQLDECTEAIRTDVTDLQRGHEATQAALARRVVIWKEVVKGAFAMLVAILTLVAGLYAASAKAVPIVREVVAEAVQEAMVPPAGSVPAGNEAMEAEESP